MAATKKVTITLTPEQIENARKLSKLYFKKENISGLISLLINKDYGRNKNRFKSEVKDFLNEYGFNVKKEKIKTFDEKGEMIKLLVANRFTEIGNEIDDEGSKHYYYHNENYEGAIAVIEHKEKINNKTAYSYYLPEVFYNRGNRKKYIVPINRKDTSMQFQF